MKWFETKHSIVLPYVLIFGAALLRLTVSHPFNFIPVFSCSLFFGASRPKREYPIPILALVGVDIFLTTHRYGFAVTGDQAAAWMWYLAVMILGAGMLRDSISTPRVIGASLMASVSFFLASNFTVWAAWGMYPKTWSGLGACYVAALPFFRNSIVSELAFSVLIFGIARHSQTFNAVRRMQGACS